MKRKILKFIVRLQRNQERPWYLPLMAFLAGLDHFILVIPTDGLMVSFVLLHPKKWLRASIWISVGSAIGAMLFAVALNNEEFFLRNWLMQLVEPETWIQVDYYIEEYGPYAVFFVAIAPVAQLPVIAVAALGQMSITTLAWVYFAGRIMKFALVGWIASHTPRLLNKLWGVRSEIKSVKALNPTLPS